ncbi:hypothetical protein RHGRI_024006 [Rhododendron griersonianum]|uniref:Uncharacterized protein n=1 Tax=Rhododendron griersonianum TaxID=479676 RepID=A0AAV6J9U5_9ERIC|nr:hypothetical protein RHGRI_024006 [Rhododendron griersonianum]
MDLESLDNMILYDSDSDDDLKIITIAATEAQQLEAESSSLRRSSTQPRNFIRRDHLCNAPIFSNKFRRQ